MYKANFSLGLPGLWSGSDLEFFVQEGVIGADRYILLLIPIRPF